MDDRVAAGDQRVDRRRVLERRDDDLFPGLGGAESARCRSRAARARARLQARPQHAAEAAGGAGQEQAAERRRGRRRKRRAAGHGRSWSVRGPRGGHRRDALLRIGRQSSYNCRPPVREPATTDERVRRAVRTPLTARPRNLALTVVDALGDRIRDGRLAPGRQAGDRVGADGRVRRQPHRHPRGAVEAAGRLRWCRRGTASAPSSPAAAADRRCSGSAPTSSDAARRRRHARAADRRRDRGGEPGGAAPQRRQPGRDARGARSRSRKPWRRAATQWALTFRFHLEIMRATQNAHFVEPAAEASARWRSRAPGSTRRPRRPTSARPICAASTPSTARSSTRSRTATAKRRAPRCAPTSPTAASGARPRPRSCADASSSAVVRNTGVRPLALRRDARRIRSLRVVPVAGRDSMLLNLSGAHGPFFTRNLAHRRPTAPAAPASARCPAARRSARRRRRRRLRRRPADRRRSSACCARCASASPIATPAAAACRPSTCAPRSTPSPRSNRRCSTCSASTSACRSRRCSAKASSATRSRCSAICSTSATARKTDLPYPRDRRRRDDWLRLRHEPALDARGDRAAGRGGAGALRLQRLQAQGRRAAPARPRSRRSPRCTSASRARASRSTRTAAGCSRTRCG